MVSWPDINRIQDFELRRQLMIKILQAEREHVSQAGQKLDELIHVLETTSDATAHIVTINVPTSITISVNGKEESVQISPDASQIAVTELMK